MSSIARWSYTNVATIWPVTVDQYGQPSYGSPYTIPCTWEDTGTIQTDNDGMEFQPRSTYWFEANYGDAIIPKRGYFIAKFDRTDVDDPISIQAQKIRKVTSWDMSPFGASEVPDWAIFTNEGV